MAPKRKRRKRFRHQMDGASGSIVIPKEYPVASPFNEREVEVVLASNGILIGPTTTQATFDEPTFRRFLDFIEQASFHYPERLGNILDLTDADMELVKGVEWDA